MKIHRLLAALLLVSLATLTASAQESGEVATLRAKAEKGNGIAQYNLGLAYAEGRGVAADPIEAFVWLSLARENGTRGRALDTLVATLDRTTLDAAQQRLAARRGGSASLVAAKPAPAPRSETPAPAAPRATPAEARPAPPAADEDAASARLRSERDALAANLSDVTAELTALRAEHARLTAKAEANAEVAQAARGTAGALQEENRTTLARLDALQQESANLKTELAQAKQSLAALAAAPKPAPDTTALDQKARELQAAQTELETSRNFGRQVESTLNRVTDQKTALEAQLAALNTETAKAGQEAADLRRAQAELNSRLQAAGTAATGSAATIAGLQEKLAAATAASTTAQAEAAALRQKPAAPAYPDLSGRVHELESALAAKPAAPAYPDLSGRVSELEKQVAADSSTLAAAKTESESTKQQVAALTQAKETAEKALAVKPAAPAYPDLSGRVHELESALAAKPAYPDLSGKVQELTAALAAKPAAPAYPDLSGRVSELEKQVAADSSTLAAAKAESESTKQQVAALTQAKETAEKALAVKPAAPAYPDLSGKVQELTAALAAKPAAPAYPDLSGRVSELEKQAATDTAAVTAAKAEADQAKQQVAALGLAKDAAEKALAAKPAAPAYPDLSGQVNELETQLAALKNTTTTAAKDLSEAQAQLAAARAATPAYPDLSGKVHELETALASKPAYPDLTGKVQELEAALAAKPAAPPYPDLSGRVSELEKQAAADATDLAAAKAEAATAQHQATAAIAQIGADAQARINALTTERDAARTAQNELGGALTKLQAEKTQLASAKDATADSARQLATLGEKLAAAEKQSATSRQERDALTAKLTDLAANVATLQADRERMQKMLADTGRQLRDGAGAAGRIKELEAQVKGHAAESEAARTTQAELRDTVARLEQDKTQLTADVQSARTAAPAYPDLSGRVHELEGQVATLQSTLAAKPAAPSYPDLSGKVNELETQVAGLKNTTDTVARNLAEAQTQLAAARSATLAAKPAAPTYPDLSGRVSELEKQVADGHAATAAAKTEADTVKQQVVSLTQAKEAAEKTLADKPATPAYPDLSGKVHELETALAAAGATQAELQGKLDGATTALQKTAKAQNPDEQVQLRRERDELAGRVTALAGEIAQLRLDRERMQKMLADAGQQMRDATAATARIKELETQVTGLTKAKDDTAAQAAALQADLAAKGAAPAYPDLSGKVHDLEAQVGSLQATLAAKPAAPVTPDLSGRVSELESALAEAKRQLAAEPAKPAPGPAVDAAGLQKQLAEAEDKLAISLRGYSLLEKERDDLAAQAGKSAEGVTAERDTLATQVAALTAEVARLKSGAAVQADALTQTAALAAERNSLAARVADAEGRVAAAQAESARAGQALADLQRSTAQGSAELAAVRTQARQLQGSNTVLAGENYQLKTMLARTAGTPAPVVAAPAAVAPAGRTHVVAGGDSLSRLSQRYYGTAGRWQEIYNANRDKISNDGALRIGTELRIP